MDRYHDAIVEIFKTSSSKHEAHRRALPVLQDMAADRRFLARVIRDHVSAPGALNVRNYPVVSMEWKLNEWFGLVINCWIPLPTKRTEVSTKAIHHHGNMLLSTVTLFGPGFEHWMFTKPELADPEKELYRFHALEKAQHAEGHVSFVDAHIPHLPWYPSELSITCCLWSNQFPTTWRDRLKRVSLVKKNEKLLRRLSKSAGLDRLAERALDVKLVELYDYLPVEDGFRGLHQRTEYERGPNEDHLCSLFHVLQRTHQEDLAPLVEDRLHSGAVEQPALVQRLLDELKAGRAIEGRLSDCHIDQPRMTFTQDDVDRSLRAVARD
jgi:hypothetical protein